MHDIRDHRILALIHQEEDRQRRGLELIASENFVSQQVLRIAGTVLTNKYAEGFPGKRYYGGCVVMDEIEILARERAKKLFNCSWANVQPHSGSQANAAVMLAILQPGDKILGFNLAHGGHLTHGAAVNFSGKLYQAVFYGVSKETEQVDWQALQELAHQHKPKLIIAGGSAYSRDWDYKKLRAIADEVKAWLLADIAHPAGLIATQLLNDPFEYCHVVTTTTHKTLRGPRGGMILLRHDFDNPMHIKTVNQQLKPMSSIFDAAVFPGTQGGPLMHIIAAKAAAFGEALTQDFHAYMRQVKSNAQVMAQAFMQKGYQVVSGGTDNHLILINLSNKKISGAQAERALIQADITVNKNMVPFDTQSPFITSGIRLGTPAVTTRGLIEKDMLQIVAWIDDILTDPNNDQLIQHTRQAVNNYMADFPIYAKPSTGIYHDYI